MENSYLVEQTNLMVNGNKYFCFNGQTQLNIAPILDIFRL